jgi:DNA modification methylase
MPMAERLSDHEIRDITKALEAGLPIDDKYRYLIFKEARQVELVWNGKNTRIQDVVLPFQVIEHIDEPRDEVKLEQQQSLFDTSGKKVQGWSNKLIWGDNKYVLSSLKSGPIRDDIEANGGIKLIYIDPPFDVGADFSTTIEIGDTEFEKAPTVLEEIAFRDTWGRGEDSFLAMIYERLKLMHSLLRQDGVLYLHCDWRISANIRIILDEIFGVQNFLNEIIWQYEGTQSPSAIKLATKHDTIFRFAKDINQIKTNELYFEHEVDRSYSTLKKDEKGYFRIQGFGDYSEASIQNFEKEGRVYHTSKGTKYLKHYIEERDGKLFKQKKISDVWNDITQLGTAIQKEKLNYPTQKPEKLIERILKIDTFEGDLVADFFVGSGTTAAVAEKYNRKWIASDIGRFSINIARKRFINIQRQLKKDGKDFRSFEVLSIGSYSFNDESQQLDFSKVVLEAYKAEPLRNSFFSGKKGNRFVSVGPLDLPLSRDFIDVIVQNAKSAGLLEIDLLAFEFGMGVVPDAIEEAKNDGVKLNLKIIPREVFDKKAVADGAVKFSEVGYLDVKIESKKLEASVTLTDFSVFYSQDSLELDGENLQKGKSRVVLDNGIIKKISKNKEGIVKIENIATSWVDWIDYWAIDFNFEDRQELKLVKHDDGRVEQAATGRNIFDNQWQSFKTNSEKIELTSSKYQYPKAGKYKIAVKVIDVFGNDTTRVFDVNVGK